MVTTTNIKTPAREAGYEMMQYIAGRITFGVTAPAGTAVPTVKIGTLPAGSLLLAVATKVVTAITGTTPTFNIGTTAAGTDVLAGIALTAGSAYTVPAAGLVMPFATDTDFYANITGTPTAGDAVVVLQFCKPLA